MSNEKQPHEKLADKELGLKAAQQVHYQDDFKKADKAAESKEEQEKESQDDK